jgi:hypothetical protein
MSLDTVFQSERIQARRGAEELIGDDIDRARPSYGSFVVQG